MSLKIGCFEGRYRVVMRLCRGPKPCWKVLKTGRFRGSKSSVFKKFTKNEQKSEKFEKKEKSLKVSIDLQNPSYMRFWKSLYLLFELFSELWTNPRFLWKTFLKLQRSILTYIRAEKS